MARVEDDLGGDGILALVKETASGFGQLVADHIRLARVEMTADAKNYVRDLAVVALGAFVIATGYGLACLAAGFGLAHLIGGALAFALLAFVHLVGGAIALVLAIGKMKQVQLMHETKQEVSRSVSALGHRELTVRH